MERLQKNNFKFSKELLAPKILRLIISKPTYLAALENHKASTLTLCIRVISNDTNMMIRIRSMTSF